MSEVTPSEAIAQKCFHKIIHQKKPLFFGITGDSGSGKSYFSALIRKKFEENRIPYSYINHDSFLVSRADREPLKEKIYTEGEFKGKTHWEILENWFRMDEYNIVIDDLRSRRKTSFYPYMRENGGVATTPITILPEDYVVFDTTMQTEKMDFVILIEVTPENIMKRKLERDKDIRTAQQIIEMQKRVQGYCWERTRPNHPDIIIDNNDFAHPFIIKE